MAVTWKKIAFAADIVSDSAYGAGWDGVTDVAPSKNAVYDKIETLSASFPSGTKMLFYQDTAPTGWTIQNTLDDKLVYITKGSAASGQTGGTVHSTGTWTQPGHAHAMSHTHTVSVVNTSTTPGGAYGIVAAQTQTTSTSSQANTGGGATANTWRPAAYCCIICSKN